MVERGARADGITLQVKDIAISFGGIRVLKGVDLEVGGREIVSVIGPNGAGKTSLLNCISGFYRPERGSVRFAGKDCTRLSPHRRTELGMGRTFQGVQLYQGMTVLDNVMAGRHVRMRTNVFQDALYWGWARDEEREHRAVAEGIIEFLHMTAIQDKRAADLSYGLMKRVDLGRALALEPRILVMDEPVAGMNLAEKEDFARLILDIREHRSIPIVLVEHDMGMVMDISDRIVVLDWGKVIAEGPPERIKKDPLVISAYLGKPVD